MGGWANQSIPEEGILPAEEGIRPAEEGIRPVEDIQEQPVEGIEDRELRSILGQTW